jgi:hypothetical protein
VSTQDDNKPFIVDEITLICKGCQGERVFPLAERIRSAKALITWMKTKATACPCGAATCDVKARLVNPN